jgi:hypothetical protein
MWKQLNGRRGASECSLQWSLNKKKKVHLLLLMMLMLSEILGMLLFCFFHGTQMTLWSSHPSLTPEWLSHQRRATPVSKLKLGLSLCIQKVRLAPYDCYYHSLVGTIANVIRCHILNFGIPYDSLIRRLWLNFQCAWAAASVRWSDQQLNFWFIIPQGKPLINHLIIDWIRVIQYVLFLRTLIAVLILQDGA